MMREGRGAKVGAGKKSKLLARNLGRSLKLGISDDKKLPEREDAAAEEGCDSPERELGPGAADMTLRVTAKPA